jgi:hypothetical protein
MNKNFILVLLALQIIIGVSHGTTYIAHDQQLLEIFVLV